MPASCRCHNNFIQNARTPRGKIHCAKIPSVAVGFEREGQEATFLSYREFDTRPARPRSLLA
jgi:hypothetical protein